MKSAPVITIADIRRAGFCVKGARRWSESKGIDFREILDGGIASDDERLAGDAHVERILAAMER